MKITKSQLKRIIREERAKLLRKEQQQIAESITDRMDVEDVVDSVVLQVADTISDHMLTLPQEEPEMFPDGPEVWGREVERFRESLAQALTDAIERTIQEQESALHSGQFGGM